MTGASPMPFAPNGPSGAGTSTISVSMSGTRSAVRDRVVEERAGQEPAGVVVHELLEERPADRLGGAAAHLALDERGVQRAADVLRDGVAEQLDLARLAIDAHVREVRCRRRRAPRLRGAAVALDRLVPAAEAERPLRDLLDGDRAVGSADRAHDAVHDLEVGGRDLELLRRRLRAAPRARPPPRAGRRVPTVYVTFDPPLAPAYGPVAVSAETTRTCSGERPNASAAMAAKPVLTPLMSTAEVTTVIVPSAFTRQTAAAGSFPPGQ